MASSPPQSGTDEESDEDVYIVKRILAEGGTDEERLFLIEWEGYPIEESTWEPEANVLSKETLKAWKEEKTRQREGLSKPLDTDEFEKRQENYNRRKRRQEKLGIPPHSGYPESDDNGNSSSDQTEEADVEVSDYEGIPSPKKSRQPLVQHHDPSFRDDDTEMHGASDESDDSPNERRRTQRPARPPSASEGWNGKEVRPTKTGIQTSANIHKAPIIEAPSVTGYQGTAHRGPVSSSTIAPREKSMRGRTTRTVGRDSLITKTKPKARRTIENRILNETRSKEPKAPQLFATKSMERRFELGARALADRPPAQLPRLINPAEYSNLGRIRKRSSATVPGGVQSSATASAAAGQQPLPSPTAAMAPMVSSPKEISPQEDTTSAEFLNDDTSQAMDKSHGLLNTRKVSFAVEETDGDQPEQLSPKAPPSGLLSAAMFHAPTTPMASQKPSPAVRKVSLANYSAKQNGVTQRPVSMDNQPQGVSGETTLKSFLGDRQAQDDPIMLTFTDVDVQNMSWGAALQQVQKNDLIFNHICRSTDIDNFKSEFNPTLLARGRVAAATGDNNKGQETISSLADYLRVNISGLLYNLESLNIIIYPTRCEEWKFIEFGIQPQHSSQLSFFSFTTPSKLVCKSYNREAESRMAKMKIDGYDDYYLLTKAVFGFSYQGLHQVDKKSPRDVFFLLFPEMAATLAEHTTAWLRSSKMECKIYTCQQAGSWHQFLKYTNNPEGGSLIIHHKMIPLIPRYPKLQQFLVNGLNNVWCVDENFPQGKYLSRLFPHGGAVCLTSGFLSGEPEMAMAFLNWFLPKRGSRASTGTWKLLVCRNVYKFLSNQAYDAAKRRAELITKLPDSLTDSQKECLAADGRLSLKNCQDRLDLMDVVGRLVRPKNDNERDLDAVLQADGTRSLIVFADESIKPSDDRGLINYFAYWSMHHLKNFRKFIAIGSKSIPKEYDEAGTRAKSSSSTTSTKSPVKSRWKHNAITAVDGANDNHDTELDDMDADDSTEESDPDVNTDPGVLQFINQTGIKRSKAAEFMERSKGNLTLALKLYEISENAKRQAEEVAAGPQAAVTPPVPPTMHATEANTAIPSTENTTTEDVVMEDAPPAAPDVALEAAPPTAREDTPSVPPPTDTSSPVQPSSQTSNAGIITSESGSRFVPRSVRSSGTVRNELNIRPGYVPPEDKEVYNVRRARSGSAGSASKPNSRSSSRGVEEGERVNGASVSPGGVLTPVMPATPSERRKDRGNEAEDAKGKGEGKGGGKLSALEWYGEKKLKGEEWNHIAVAGWEEAFKLLRVEYEKK